jgi:hypothetical protein
MLPTDPALAKALLDTYGLTLEQSRLWATFLPEAVSRRVEAYKKKTRFVHYTSADAALKIARSGIIWLRNTACMNDSSEAKHGIDQVVSFFRSDDAKPFWQVLDRCHAGLDVRIQKHYDEWVFDLRTETYLVSLSEHNQSEDEIGRLSMWRAYGHGTGIALVLNPDAFHSSSDALNTFSYPVCYLGNGAAIEEFKKIVANVVNEEAFLRTQSEEAIQFQVWSMLEYFSVCMKHPGFGEEREWRVIHRPQRSPSLRVTSSVEILGGVPQKVYQLPLRDIPEEGLIGASIPLLIERVIVGPTQYPLVVYNALVAELGRLGVEQANRKVYISHIPIRQSNG